MIKFEFVAKTDVGKIRDHNEDAFGIYPEQGLFFVCDGMGGHASGDYASKKTVDTVQNLIRNHVQNKKEDFVLKEPERVTPCGRLLSSFILLTNRLLFRLAVLYPKLRGMGTTFVSVMFEDSYVNIVNVGDSRVYRLRNSELTQLSVDHSWVEELVQDGEINKEEVDSFSERNVITRALGTDAEGKVDWKAIKIKKDDIYLLCSDGLCGEIDDNLIKNTLNDNTENLESAVSELIKAALDAGGSDNVTVILVRIKDEITKEPDDINLNELITISTDQRINNMLDAYIDKKFNLNSIDVPKGVEREKEKFYKNPIFIAIVAIIMIFGVLTIIKSPWISSSSTSSLPQDQTVGDILIRTQPIGATIKLYKDSELIEEKIAPADFLSLEAGAYSIDIVREGYEKKTMEVFSKEGKQELWEVFLTKKAELQLILGINHGFDPNDFIYINDNICKYYGQPLTVQRIGFVGKNISIERGEKHVIKVGDIEREIIIPDNKNNVLITFENGNITIGDE